MKAWLVGMVLSGGVSLCYWWYIMPLHGPDWGRLPWVQRRTQAWQDLVVAAGLGRLKARWFILSTVLSSGLIGLLTYSLSQLWALAALAWAASALAPWLWLQSRANRARARLRQAWPHAIDTLISGVKAGLSLGETMLALAPQAPDALRPALRAFAAQYRAHGHLESALDHLKDTLADPVADRIVEALRVASEVGGNQLLVLLQDLASMLRSETQVRAEVEARQSWTVTGAKLAAAAPWLVLLMLLSRPETVTAYSTYQGSLLLIGGAFISALAYLLMRRIGRLPESPRTLR